MTRTLSCLFFFLLVSCIVSTADEPFSWPLDRLDTARDLTWLNKEEKEMVLEMNKLRYNPGQYALQYIEWMQLYFVGKKIELPNNPSLEITEGKEAFDELIRKLKDLPPRPLLLPSRGMTKAERLLVYDQSLTGKTGHISSGNKKTEDRLATFGNWYGTKGEIICYGESDPRTILINLLFDNSPDKIRRERLLNPAFQFVGISIGHHKIHRQMCAISLCTKYVER